MMKKFGGNLNGVGIDGFTSLQRVAKTTQNHILKSLINAGADLDVVTERGTALSVAICDMKNYNAWNSHISILLEYECYFIITIYYRTHYFNN